MSKVEQKRLYEHFKKLSVEGTTDKQRVECGKYAKEILDSFPDFEKAEKPVEETKPKKAK